MSVRTCKNNLSQVVWVLRKHIHFFKNHKNGLSHHRAHEIFFFLLNSHTLPLLSRVASKHTHVYTYIHHYHPLQNHDGSNVPAAEWFQIHSPPKSPPHIDPLRIVCRWLALNRTKPPMTHYGTMLVYLFISSWHHLSSFAGPLQTGTGLHSQKRHIDAHSHHSKEEKSPYLFFTAIPPILFSRLDEVCKKKSLDIAWV